MSATRDKSQKITFVYSNLYSIYRKGVERARDGAIRESASNSPSLAAQAVAEQFKSGVVIKASANPAAAPVPAQQPRISPYTPAELIGKRVPRPAVLQQAKPASPDAIQSLKQNLESLNDLQARLRFMLKELEDLIKE